jgi:hypothetical protein
VRLFELQTNPEKKKSGVCTPLLNSDFYNVFNFANETRKENFVQVLNPIQDYALKNQKRLKQNNLKKVNFQKGGSVLKTNFLKEGASLKQNNPKKGCVVKSNFLKEGSVVL